MSGPATDPMLPLQSLKPVMELNAILRPLAEWSNHVLHAPDARSDREIRAPDRHFLHSVSLFELSYLVPRLITHYNAIEALTAQRDQLSPDAQSTGYAWFYPAPAPPTAHMLHRHHHRESCGGWS